MNKKTSSQDDVIRRFINYGEQNYNLPDSITTSVFSEKNVSIMRLIDEYRKNGHLRSNLNPLLKDPKTTGKINIGAFGLSEGDLDLQINSDIYSEGGANDLGELIGVLEETYCGTLGAEYMHLINKDEVIWLQGKIEALEERQQLSNEYRKWILKRLTSSESFEKYLHNKYVGQKRFSLEGGDSLIPLLNILIERASVYGVKKVCMAMAHRGRLNVLVNIMGKPAELLFQEFAGIVEYKKKQTGDVKYHLGFSSTIKTNNENIDLTLMFNPSHLELVNPVLEGYVRYHQDTVNDQGASNLVVPILIHGDAAFTGQGVVMETLNMSQSRGYSTRGTVHIIINNQIGFTTSEQLDARSTDYCTDVVKMINAPVLHVNADDLQMVDFVTKLALDYRMEFKKDIVIDLTCYRRHGHSEVDDPDITQPLMYKAIRKLPTTRFKYAEEMIAEGLIRGVEADNFINEYKNELKSGHNVGHNIISGGKSNKKSKWVEYFKGGWDMPYKSGVQINKIKQLSDNLQITPKDFDVHPRVKKIMVARKEMGDGFINVDWGFAENLAYATLVDDGINIRLTGQDCGRGTFAHRHAVLHDQSKPDKYIPLQNIRKGQGTIKIVDSILSEESALGFEYGYSIADPKSLVIWEAQFGDFANGAQAIIDQYICSGEAKWGRMSGLVMLLPHGLEGQGPEHSSARLERYLQLASAHNIQVCIPSTASQIFHLLRRQNIRMYCTPLIVMTPKSLLRNPMASSPLSRFEDEQFKLIYEEQYDNIKPENVDTVILCSGKVFYELLSRRQEDQINNIAIIRIEQIYPFPLKLLREELSNYKNSKRIIWCQEEPINQGAWYSTRHKFIQCVTNGQVLEVVSRGQYAAPAEGNIVMHKINQNNIIEQALGIQPIIIY